MRETGMLSIVKQRYTFQVRYASFNPFDMDRAPYPCADEDALITVLGHWGIDTCSLQQTVAALRKGSVAVLRVVLSEAQLQSYFPQHYAPRVWQDARNGDAHTSPPASDNSPGCHRVEDVDHASTLVSCPVAAISDPAHTRLAALTRRSQTQREPYGRLLIGPQRTGGAYVAPMTAP